MDAFKLINNFKEFNMNKYIFVLFLLLAFFSVKLFVQSEIDSKIKSLDGEVNKVTIQTDKQIIVFEEGDAKTLFERIKYNSIDKKSITVLRSDDDSDFVDKKKIIILNSDDGGDAVFQSNDNDVQIIVLNDDKNDHNIKKESDFDKKVEVKIENGKENAQDYEGEEADIYLKEHKNELDTEEKSPSAKHCKKL